ncbi:MAG: short-chain dehydrogenase, partial [Sphingobacteriia bacterium 35-40-5]
MNLDLTRKRALVCGSTQGIGRSSAKELALLGASITLLARNEDKLKEVLQGLSTDQNQKHHYLVADFSDPDQLKLIVNEYVLNNQIDILINNTGGPAGGK